MKRIYLFLMLFAVLPAFSLAAENVRLTRFAGQQITGVTATDMFEVQLVRSNTTQAIAEIDSEFEPYLRFELTNGIVRVGLNLPRDVQRRVERDNGWKNRTLKLTVHLPELRSLTLSDMTKLTRSDAFDGTAVDIKLSDMSKVDRLELNMRDITLKMGDMVNAELAVKSHALVIRVDDMAKLAISGEATEIRAETNDMAKLNGAELKTQDARLKASDMSKITLRVSNYLYGRSSDMASINYEGNPSSIDLQTPKKTIYNVN